MGARPGPRRGRGRRLNLFAFGLGYTAQAMIAADRSRFHAVAGTTRDLERTPNLARLGVATRRFDASAVDPAISPDLEAAEAVLVSIPPDADGDPTLRRFAELLSGAPRLAWVGYLSTIGVYGDRGGAWVDETTPPAPSNDRSRRRLAAEESWLAWGRQAGKAVQVFRLAGIYGPGRNAPLNLAAGSARRLVQPGQVFNRIHVADDEPAPPQDVVAYAAALLGVEPPPEIPFAQAAFSPMAASFYAENKRASAARIKGALQISWRYPSYREGLRALLAAGEAGTEGSRGDVSA